MDNKKMMLLYGFNEKELKILELLINKNNLPRYKIMEPGMGQMRLSDVIEGMNFEVLDKTMPSEKVILFNNLEEKELYMAVDLVRAQFNPRPILAAVTEMSIQWTVKELLEHLIEERDWALKNGR